MAWGKPLVGTVVLIVGAVAVLATCQPADRTASQRGPATSGPAGSVVPSSSPSPTPGDRTRWSVNLRDSTEAAPVFAGGVTFVSTHHGTLAALDARSGAVRWRGDLDLVTSGVAVADGRLYVAGLDSNASRCQLRTFDAATGAPGWLRSADACTGTEVAAGAGRVYLVHGGLLHDTGRVVEPARVVALDARTGRMRWSRRIDPSTRASVPMVAGGAVYVSTERAELIALNAASGRIRWRIAVGYGGVVSRPVARGGLVHVIRAWGYGESAVYAFDAETGERRWVRHASGTMLAPAFAADTLVVVHQDARVRGLNHRTGQVRWAREPGTDVADPPAPPVAAGNLVYVSLAGALHALDARTGRLRWTDTTPPPGTPLAAHEGVLYLGANDGTITAVDSP
jgi:outer membrane protein assembly factor BamB